MHEQSTSGINTTHAAFARLMQCSMQKDLVFGNYSGQLRLLMQNILLIELHLHVIKAFLHKTMNIL